MVERSKLSISGVYCFKNCVDGKVYIGSSSTIYNRKLEHIHMLRKRKHHSAHFQFAWNKYGESAFEFLVLEICELVDLFEREQYWMDQYRSFDKEFGYNVCSIAGSRVGVKSPEVAASNRRRTYDGKIQAAKVRGLVRSQYTRGKMAEAKRNWWKNVNNRKAASKRTKEQWDRRRTNG